MLVLNTNPVEFIPEAEKTAEKPVTFIVKPPTREVTLKLQDILQESLVASQDATNPDSLIQTFKFSEYVKILMDECIVGWKNVFTKDANGELVEVEFSKDKLSMITDIAIINELVSFVDSLAHLGK